MPETPPVKCLSCVQEPCPHPSPHRESKDQKLQYKKGTKVPSSWGNLRLGPESEAQPCGAYMGERPVADRGPRRLAPMPGSVPMSASDLQTEDRSFPRTGRGPCACLSSPACQQPAPPPGSAPLATCVSSCLYCSPGGISELPEFLVHFSGVAKPPSAVFSMSQADKPIFSLQSPVLPRAAPALPSALTLYTRCPFGHAGGCLSPAPGPRGAIPTSPEGTTFTESRPGVGAGMSVFQAPLFAGLATQGPEAPWQRAAGQQLPDRCLRLEVVVGPLCGGHLCSTCWSREGVWVGPLRVGPPPHPLPYQRVNLGASTKCLCIPEGRHYGVAKLPLGCACILETLISPVGQHPCLT